MKIQLLSDLHNEFLRNGKDCAGHHWSGSITETDTDVTLSDVIVAHTFQTEIDDTAGTGIGSYGGAHIEIDRFVVTQNALWMIALIKSSIISITLRRSKMSNYQVIKCCDSVIRISL